MTKFDKASRDDLLAWAMHGYTHQEIADLYEVPIEKVKLKLRSPRSTEERRASRWTTARFFTNADYEHLLYFLLVCADRPILSKDDRAEAMELAQMVRTLLQKDAA